MSQAIFDAFTAAVHTKLAEAIKLYDLTFKVEEVTISYNLRGKTAGYASWDNRSGKVKYSLRFNAEAILKYNDNMTNDVIPHEVAHLVCFDRPWNGKDHDHGWKRVCRTLGGDDSRTHDMVLTPAKVVESRRVDYILDSGRVCRVGPKHHKAIQGGSTGFFMRNPKEYIRAEHWVGYGKVAPTLKVAALKPSAIPGLNIVRSDIPALPAAGSKREKAELIYKANKHLARGEVIKLFVAHADMTPAGAATYYQNFKKAGI